MTDITDAGPRLRQMNDALEEIERLRLTHAEREAVERAIDTLVGVQDLSAYSSQQDDSAACTLRSLLDRQPPGA